MLAEVELARQLTSWANNANESYLLPAQQFDQAQGMTSLDWRLAMSDLLSSARPTFGEMQRLSERVGAHPPRPACELPEVIDEFVRAISRDNEMLIQTFK